MGFINLIMTIVWYELATAIATLITAIILWSISVLIVGLLGSRYE